MHNWTHNRVPNRLYRTGDAHTQGGTIGRAHRQTTHTHAHKTDNDSNNTQPHNHTTPFHGAPLAQIHNPNSTLGGNRPIHIPFIDTNPPGVPDHPPRLHNTTAKPTTAHAPPRFTLTGTHSGTRLLTAAAAAHQQPRPPGKQGKPQAKHKHNRQYTRDLATTAVHHMGARSWIASRWAGAGTHTVAATAPLRQAGQGNGSALTAAVGNRCSDTGEGVTNKNNGK